MSNKGKTIEFVDLKRQYASISKEIDAAINEVIQNTDFVNGKAVKEFEKSFAEYCGLKYCVPCGNGTDALEIGMKALGIGAGDKVIVPANSFVASGEAVNNIGADVIFCDIDADSYNLDPNKIEACIDANTKAIMVVHLYGRMADMDPIVEIAQKHNLFIIEDASQAIGSTYKGKKPGQSGDFAVFSFYPGKNLGCYGDGGALVMNDENLYLTSKKIANHGRIAKYDHEIIGRNSRLDTIQAAILNAKLPFIDQWNEARYKIAQQYHKGLEGINEIIRPKDGAQEKSVYHLYVIRVDADVRPKLKTYLAENGIATGVHYPIALPQLAAYAYLGHQKEDFPLSDLYQDQILSLPIFPEMETEEIDYVCDHLKAFFNK
ncbi:MAG: DegT/DnrJ/EryC1/StrS family aminotransferase [Saprospiraceae bacterium]